MTSILRKRIDKLIHGDDGAALVITLALFMMMYISCAGVFAIGQTVKEKMILQNAADAAAYSAAIVQADTLSRIATINRAMAWTYKSMVCCQMDYITWKWVNKSCEMWEDDSPAYNTLCKTIGAPLGVGNTIDLNGAIPLESTAKAYNDEFRSSDQGKALESMISKHREALAEMNKAIWDDLVPNMTNEMIKAAEAAVEANLPGYFGDRCLMKMHMVGAEGWTRQMDPDDPDEEDRFLAFANLNKDEFRDWFPLDSSTNGFVRAYGGPLSSFWVWIDKSGVWHTNGIDAVAVKDSYYEGRLADPCVLTENYFDHGEPARGAFSIAVAKRNENPWAWLVDLSAKSLYDVFTPSGAARWTWAVASAQAAYRPFGAAVGRDYSLEYETQENLRTDDWDAVFVPVYRSFKDDDFSDFMTKADGWEKVAASSGMDPSLYDASSSDALPSMHNSDGSMKDLKWGEVLKKVYH